MTDTPLAKSKITVIIPVYNAEKYLRQCLDSVVNQTLRDIQILCVNDGSTDGSLAILQEYAGRDSRIEIIDQPNSGCPGLARNAGLPHARGEYIQFLDNDDWIDPTLCEKAYYRLESTGADVVFFFFDIVGEGKARLSNKQHYSRYSVTDLSISEMIERLPHAPWNRVFRKSFLVDHDLRFPPVKSNEDQYLHWAVLVHEPRVEIILEELYFHRYHQASFYHQAGEYLLRIFPTFSLIKGYLRQMGRYEQYRALFLKKKFSSFSLSYSMIRKSNRSALVRTFQESVDEDEMDFLRNSGEVPTHVRGIAMYHLLGDRSLYWRNCWHLFNRYYLRKVIKPIEHAMKIFRRKNTGEERRRIRELCEQLAERDRTLVLLRNQPQCSGSHAPERDVS